MKSFFGIFRRINYYSITCTFKNVWSWWTLPESSSKLDKLCLIFMQPIVCSLLKTFSFDNHSVFRWLNAPTDAPESVVVALDSPFEKPLLGNWYMLYNRRYSLSWMVFPTRGESGRSKVEKEDGSAESKRSGRKWTNGLLTENGPHTFTPSLCDGEQSYLQQYVYVCQGLANRELFAMLKRILNPIVAVQTLDRYTFQWAYIT